MLFTLDTSRVVSFKVYIGHKGEGREKAWTKTFVLKVSDPMKFDAVKFTKPIIDLHNAMLLPGEKEWVLHEIEIDGMIDLVKE